jgi:aryl-alcohol dehydrogenase-like predicted oxidoreductase
MEYCKLGSSNLEVSRIGLGTWAIGGWRWGGTDEKQAILTVQKALDLGINLIDTAPVYGFGLSEEIIGRAIAEYGNRDKVVIATKLGVEWDEQKRIWRNCTQARIKKEIDDSLRRLHTDYIDLYQVHWPDFDTPMEETAEALMSFYHKGKIRTIGVSNFNVEQMKLWQKVAPLHSNQLQLNLFQTHLLETFEYCGKNNISTLTWGTLAHGLLTGKLTVNANFPKGDLRNDNPMFQGKQFCQHLNAVNKLRDLAIGRGKTVAQLAVKWILQQQGVGIALWGARRPEQIEGISGLFNWQLSSAELAQIDKIIKETITDPVKPKANPGPPLRSRL